LGKVQDFFIVVRVIKAEEFRFVKNGAFAQVDICQINFSVSSHYHELLILNCDVNIRSLIKWCDFKLRRWIIYDVLHKVWGLINSERKPIDWVYLNCVFFEEDYVELEIVDLSALRIGSVNFYRSVEYLVKFKSLALRCRSLKTESIDYKFPTIYLEN